MHQWVDYAVIGVYHPVLDPTDTQGISLLKTLWKIMQAIIDTRVWASIHFHYFIHRFRAGVGTCIVTMELNLAQGLIRFNQVPFFLVFLDLRKAYNKVYRGCFIRTLELNVTGPHMCKLIANFWAHQEVVTIENGYHGPNFKVISRTM